jgi:uroporphyrin-III C-methyltransferase/precorrin-2 dehydrogenase/sirohydrochlorin ferrochelatase
VEYRVDYLPIFIDIRARHCLIVGGGAVAARKTELLVGAGARVRIVAPRVCDALIEQAAHEVVEVSLREFDDGDLVGMTLVIAATDRPDVNARVATAAQHLAIPVNVVDSPALCTFIMPALVDRSPVLVAVSTAGASPVLARLVRGRIEAALPSALGRLAAFAALHRDEVKRALPAAARRRFWEQALSGTIADLVLAGRELEAGDALVRRLRDASTAPMGDVALIAVGDGEPDRQSLGAARLLGGADLVLYEPATLDTVRALARRDAELTPLPDGVQLLEIVRTRAQAGQRICVVRAGDPQQQELAVQARSLSDDAWTVTVHQPAPRHRW